MKDALKIRETQVKRFLVSAGENGTERVTIVLSRVSKQEIAGLVSSLEKIDGVDKVDVSQHRESQK